jgi:hypothetical protein
LAQGPEEKQMLPGRLAGLAMFMCLPLQIARSSVGRSVPRRLVRLARENVKKYAAHGAEENNEHA